jgi:hypothetical protein
MNMTDSIVEMKGSLKKIKLENILIQQIRNEIHSSFVNTQDVKMNEDLIRAICCAIENNVNGQKVDKLDLFFKIYRVTFGETDEKDVHFLTTVIKILNDNGKIKARSMLSKLFRFLGGFLLKK